MFDKTRVGHGVLGDFSGSKAYAPWSKVVLQVDEELSYTAGDDTGRTLTAANPFGTQQMAEDMLRRLKGSSYQPYSGTDALLDPAAELGDAVEIRVDVVDDLEDACAELRKQKYIMVSKPTEAVAFCGSRVCFLFNKNVGLIELVEPPAKIIE